MHHLYVLQWKRPCNYQANENFEEKSRNTRSRVEFSPTRASC